jgi:hypothetical protein
VVGDSASLVGKAKRPVCVIEPKSNAETTSALLELDTSHTKCNRERKMVSGLCKPLAQVSKLRIGKDLVITKVSPGTKVIGYDEAGAKGKHVKPQVQRFKKTWAGKNPVVDPKSVRHCICHTYLGEIYSYDDCDN